MVEQENHKAVMSHFTQPAVTILIAAYNEAPILMEKIRNCYALDYPGDQMQILVVTDGSTDGSEELLRGLPLVEVLHQPAREGKLKAVHRAMKWVKTPLVVLTDANCLLNREALRAIVSHYVDPNVGAVAGEKRVAADRNSSGQGEGLYWRYESFLKKLDSQYHSVVGAAGELFSFRTNLYFPVANGTIIEDFVLSMDIASRGYKVVYEPNAVATETSSASMAEEWKRKVRICAGGFQAIAHFAFLLRPARFNKLGFQFLSHRLLRWAVVPFLLPLILLASVWLASTEGGMYHTLWLVQAAGYALAVLGLLYWRREKMPRALNLPFQFAMMNAAAYAGLWRYWHGQQSAVWEKAARAKESLSMSAQPTF